MKITGYEFLIAFDGDRWVAYNVDRDGSILGELGRGETPVSAMIAAEIAVRRVPRIAECSP